MSWNGNYWAKPLIFLRKISLKNLQKDYSYDMPASVEELLPEPFVSIELMLLILIQNGLKEEATQLLCYGISPREGLWWMLRCYRFIKEKQAEDFAKDGLTPSERRKKNYKELAAKLSDRSEIDAAVEKNKELQKARAQELEDQIKEHLAPSPLELIKKALAEIGEIHNGIVSRLPAKEREAMERTHPDAMNNWKAVVDKMAQDMEGPIKVRPMSEEETRTSGDSIEKMIKDKTSQIKPAIQQELDKHFPLKMRGLPHQPAPAKFEAAYQAALAWLLNPTDELGAKACEAALAAKKGPENMLAYIAFWSSSLLVSATGRAPGNPGVPPRGMISLLAQLASMPIDELDYDARFDEFFRLGIECLQGISTWDKDGNEAQSHAEPPPAEEPIDDNALKSRFGFGRSNA